MACTGRGHAGPGKRGEGGSSRRTSSLTIRATPKSSGDESRPLPPLELDAT